MAPFGAFLFECSKGFSFLRLLPLSIVGVFMTFSCSRYVIPLLKLAYARALRVRVRLLQLWFRCPTFLVFLSFVLSVFYPPVQGRGGLLGGGHTGLLLDLPVWTDTFLVSGGGSRGISPCFV